MQRRTLPLLLGFVNYRTLFLDLNSTESLRLTQLKVVHFSHNDQKGGGPLACFRLHRALSGAGADSRMLVMKRYHDDPAVEAIVPLPVSGVMEAPLRMADRSVLRLYPGRDREVIWSPGWFSLPGFAGRRVIRSADVLSFYWINGGFLSVGQIGRLLALGKPVVWRLSDFWPFTGGCHHAGDCRGYEDACGRCPQLGSGARHDLSARLLRAKMRWPKGRLTVVSPSRWLADLAKDSAVFGDCRIERITTGVDIDLFSPMERKAARQRLGLPLDRKLILFGANNGVQNPRKGFSHLVDALSRLKALGKADDVELVVFGQAKPAVLPVSLPVHMMGFIDDELAKATLFSAVDIFATPSLEENLPNTVIEAMAAGTPVVAFDVGGTGELIEHQVTGYLARPGDGDDFCRGLAFVLNQEGEAERLGDAARRFVVRYHDLRRIAGQYLDLYTELMVVKGQDQA